MTNERVEVARPNSDDRLHDWIGFTSNELRRPVGRSKRERLDLLADDRCEMQDKIKTFRDKLRRLPRSRMAALEAILLIERPSTGHCHGYLFYLLLLAWEQASKPVATA